MDVAVLCGYDWRLRIQRKTPRLITCRVPRNLIPSARGTYLPSTRTLGCLFHLRRGGVGVENGTNLRNDRRVRFVLCWKSRALFRRNMRDNIYACPWASMFSTCLSDCFKSCFLDDIVCSCSVWCSFCILRLAWAAMLLIANTFKRHLFCYSFLSREENLLLSYLSVW